MRLWIKYSDKDLINLNLVTSIDYEGKSINFYFNDYYLTWEFTEVLDADQVYEFIVNNILSRLDDISQSGQNLIDIYKEFL